jgi:hypothetical protein
MIDIKKTIREMITETNLLRIKIIGNRNGNKEERETLILMETGEEADIKIVSMIIKDKTSLHLVSIY